MQDIIINRGKVCKIEDLPPYSIALDGFVSGPVRDNINHRYSLDHHSGVIRDCTLSATAQAHTFVSLGFDPEPYTAYCNDADLDVCMSIWCLSNPEKCHDSLVVKLVEAINRGDMMMGALDHLSNGMSKVLKWIASSELESKKHDDYYKISDEGLRAIMEATLHHIDRYVQGEAQTEISKYHYKHEFKILENYDSWALIESKDPHVYSELYKNGFERVVVIRPLTDGSLSVAIAKKADITDNFDLEGICEDLNKLESGWGGGSTIKGAPRNHDGSRSKLKIEQIIEIVKNRVL